MKRNRKYRFIVSQIFLAVLLLQLGLHLSHVWAHHHQGSGTHQHDSQEWIQEDLTSCESCARFIHQVFITSESIQEITADLIKASPLPVLFSSQFRRWPPPHQLRGPPITR